LKQKKKIRDTIDLLPRPRPTNTPEFIREKLKNVSVRCREKDLARVKEIASNRLEGEISVGWNFPSENAINEIWDDWERKFEEQVDIEKSFVDHFSDLKLRHAELEAKEAAEFAS